MSIKRLSEVEIDEYILKYTEKNPHWVRDALTFARSGDYWGLGNFNELKYLQELNEKRVKE